MKCIAILIKEEIPKYSKKCNEKKLNAESWPPMAKYSYVISVNMFK